MAMTDGCARVLELAGTTKMKQEILPSLTSRDPEKAWTAGQWMTEKPGGSDVSLTETVAKPLAETYVSLLLSAMPCLRPSRFTARLQRRSQETPSSSMASSGVYCSSRIQVPSADTSLSSRFSSATDGNVALALARTGGEGSRGLSLFAVKMRKEDGKTNGIFIHRLKRKFGTKVSCSAIFLAARGSLLCTFRRRSPPPSSP